jgi:hypothetical protein
MSPEKSRKMEADLGNIRGNVIERKIARLLKSHPGISWVRITQRNKPDDKNKRDIIVRVSVDELPDHQITVFVQAKASNRGVQHFAEGIRKSLGQNGINLKADVQEWMLQNKVILLNGDLVKSRSGKQVKHLSDGEILASFDSQLQQIIEREKGLRAG